MAATLNVTQNIIYICIYIYVKFIYMQNVKESENPTNKPGERQHTH